MFTIDGLVSGLDTSSIITDLVAIQENQINRLTARKDLILAEQTAFQGIEARILGLRSSMSRLNRTTSSVFDQRIAVSSDDQALTAVAGNDAIEGTFQIQVNSLAKAHQIGSNGFESTSSTITEGTISFRLGDRPETTIEIDGTNNTVSGLVSAINNQSDDINATIINDPSSGQSRILLTSRFTGAENQITVDNNLGAGSGDIVRPDFTGAAIQEAADATVQLGSGPGAITASYATNEVDGLIENVTLNLLKAEPGKDISVSIERDTEAATESIQDFVDQYNSVISYIEEQTRFNPDTQVASPLLGNRNVSTIRNRLSSFVTDSVPGLDKNLNRLSQLGISIGNTGQLTVNTAQLGDILSGRDENVELNDVKRLFGFTGESNNGGIDFLLGSSRTIASTEPYEVDILQAAEQASVLATNALASSIVIDSSNNEFTLEVNGVLSETLTLAEGTYTQQELADHLETVINSSSELNNQEVTVSLESGQLEIRSTAYGLSSTIDQIGGTAASTLGFTGSESGTGRDVAGSFIVNGVVETATGSGRLLIGDSDNENTADLQLRITLDPSQVSTGVEGEITVTRGITSQLDFYFGELLDTTTGSIATVNEDYDLRIESLDASIERVREITESRRNYLIEEFTALERALSELQTTSGFLASQLTSIAPAAG